MITLRPYQLDVINKTRNLMKDGNRSVLVVAPTGSGKTVMFSSFTQQAVQKGNRVLILAHREELLDQISETLCKFKVKHSFISASRPTNYSDQVQVGSVLTVINRTHFMHKPDIIIIDEAHHCASTTTWGRVIKHFNTWAIGVTATPTRLSGEPLGDIFNSMVVGPSVRELIDGGSLCDYKYYAPQGVDLSSVHMSMGDYVKSELVAVMDKPTITGSAVNEYKKHLTDKRAAVFCVSVQHAENVARQFNSSGIPAASIDGKMDRHLRRELVEKFKRNETKILTNCSIITEGFDLPAMDGVILLRPTLSVSLYLQMVGRALRTYPGKECAIILDHAGNATRHGLPCDDREWSLNVGIKASRKSKDSGPPIKICERCFGAQPIGKASCIYCSFVFQSKVREVAEVDGDLKELDAKALRRKRFAEQSRAQTEDDLYRLGIEKGYKHPRRWAKYIIQARQAKKLKARL